MARKSRQDWLDQGLRTLADQGLGGLTIEALAAALGLTKGSFYHHFQNMEAFEGELLAHWSDQYLSTADRLPPDPLDRLALLDTIIAETFGPITEPELPIRMWAAQDPRARPYVEAVDEHRRRIVLELIRGAVRAADDPELIADLLSTMAIGSMTVLPRVPPARVLALYDELKRVYRLGGERP